MSKPYKTDDSIKEFIDSKEVLTMRELVGFMYPENTKYNWKRSYSNPRIAKYWNYVLETKNWAKIKNHINYKIKNGNFNRKNFNKYKEIYDMDERIRTCGTRRAQRLLMNIYKFHLARSVISNYNKRIHDDILK